MADISKEIQDFKNATYGEEVRDSLVSLAQKVNTETELSTTHVNDAVNKATSASEKANEASEDALLAISKADITLKEAITAKDNAMTSANQATLSAENAKISCDKASEAADTAQNIADGLEGFNGKAESISYQDTYNLGKSNLQSVIDEVTRRVLNELLLKSDKYDGLDSTSTELWATANAVRKVNEKSDNNSTSIRELNSNLESIKDIGAAALLGTITATGAANALSYNLNDYKRLEVQLYNMENKIIGCCTLLSQNISPQINAWINSYYDGATHCNVQFLVSTDSIYVISFSNSNVWTSCYIKVFGVK